MPTIGQQVMIMLHFSRSVTFSVKMLTWTIFFYTYTLKLLFLLINGSFFFYTATTSVYSGLRCTRTLGGAGGAGRLSAPEYALLFVISLGPIEAATMAVLDTSQTYL